MKEGRSLQLEADKVDCVTKLCKVTGRDSKNQGRTNSTLG